MSKEVIDVLPPYEDEVLVSWIVRMLRLYFSGKLGPHTDIIMKDLFGPDSTEKPGLYFQKGLEYFVKHCELKNTRIFESEYTVMQNMSVLPFYIPFCTDSQIQNLKNNYYSYEVYAHMEAHAGIRSELKYLERAPYFKFCPICMKEQNEIYLKREHQIQGNLVCWKHRCFLNRVPYKLEWKYIDFVSNIENKINITTPDIPVESQSVAIVVSMMIHTIMDNGFLDDLYTLKKKLSSRLLELEIVTEKGTFYDLQTFTDSLNAHYIYKRSRVEYELLAAIGENTHIHVNPMIYLFLILRLFGGLESYYAYVPNENPVLFSKSKILNGWVGENDINYFVQTSDKKIFREYSILGDTKDEIIVKHLTCNMIYRFSKKNRRFRKCRNCKNQQGKNWVDMKGSVSNIRYMTTEEYGYYYSKKIQQIAIYCRQNRIPGAIKTGSGYLVPENAPYPEDMRLKPEYTADEIKQVRFEYWSSFNDYVSYDEDYVKVFREMKPSKHSSRSLSIGSSRGYIKLYMLKRTKKILIELHIPNNKELFYELYDIKDDIEAEFGFELEWCEHPNRKYSRIAISKSVDYTDKSTWNEQFGWLMDMSLRFRNVFKKYI